MVWTQEVNDPAKWVEVVLDFLHRYEIKWSHDLGHQSQVTVSPRLAFVTQIAHIPRSYQQVAGLPFRNPAMSLMATNRLYFIRSGCKTS